MEKTLKDAEAVTPEQLMGMTLPQVDELFAAVWGERYTRVGTMLRSWDGVYHAVGARRVSRSGWSMSFYDMKEKAEHAAVGDPGGKAATALARVNAIKATIDELDTGVLAKLEAEEDRRGGWNRAYLAVTNGTGHVHKTRYCSTCNNGEQPTEFDWLIEWSGKSEAEIVKAAGNRACTVCYDSKELSETLRAALKEPTRMFSRNEITAAAAREVREAKRVKVAALKAAKAIASADGGPLRVYTWTQKAHQRQGLVDVPAREFDEALKTLHAARGWLTGRFDPVYGDAGQHRDLNAVADAVALKEGKDRDTVIAEAKARAAKRK